MKKLFSALFLAFSLSAFAGNLITYTLTVTNPAGTTNGQTITVQGSTRTFTNSVVTPSTQISTNRFAGGTATNVFNHFGNYRISGVSLEQSATNVVKFYGFDITASVSDGWGTLSSSTSISTNSYTVTVPFTTLTATNQTNVPSLLVAGLNAFSQTSLSQTSTVMSEVSGLTNTQSVSGLKTFTAANIYSNSAQRFVGGAVSNVTVSATSIAGTSLNINGSGTIAANLTIGGDVSVSTLNAAEANVTGQINGTALTVDTSVTAQSLVISSNITNNGDLSNTRFDNSSLANGVNAALNTGTNVYVKVSGPSAAFSINGIANGRDGKQLQIQNSTGYPMTIANDSGADATPANRIYTGLGADLVVSNIHAVVSFTYDGSLSRWILHTFSGTNGVTGGGGSQTPIAQTVNYAGFGATNIGVVSTTNLNVFGTVTVPFVIATNADYQIRTNDYAVIVDMTSIGTSTDTFLPTNAPQRMVLELSVYDPDVNYAVTVRSPDGEDIRTPQGSVPTLVLESFGGTGDKTGSAKFIHSGTNWWVISRNTNPQ